MNSKTHKFLGAALLILCCSSIVSAEDIGAISACDLIVDVALDDAMIQPHPSGAGSIITWAWGSLVLESTSPVPLDDGMAFGWKITGDLEVFGPRDDDGKAPLTFLAEGMTLVVEGDVAISSVEGATRLSRGSEPMNPMASLAILLAILILTALMMRTTRRNLANR